MKKIVRFHQESRVGVTLNTYFFFFFFFGLRLNFNSMPAMAILVYWLK